MLAHVVAARFPVLWITTFHVLNACAFIPFARATWVSWYPKAPKPLAAFFATGVLIDGFLRHVVPLLPSSMLPDLPTDPAMTVQGCIDACSVVFLVTFVTALFLDTTTNVALGGFVVAIVSVVTDLFDPNDALKARAAARRALLTCCPRASLAQRVWPHTRPQVLGCGVDWLCWSADVVYTRRHFSAYQEDAALCLIKTASNGALAGVCILGRQLLLKAAEADAAEESERQRAAA